MEWMDDVILPLTKCTQPLDVCFAMQSINEGLVAVEGKS